MKLCLLAGSGHPVFAQALGQRLGVPLLPVQLGKYASGELWVRVEASVRDADVYLIQSALNNEHLFELLILIHACKTSSARRGRNQFKH